MQKLNIVYAYMNESRFEVAIPGCDARAVWTRTEERDADIVVYLNGYSYREKHALRSNVFRILYIFEPIVVYPRHYFSSTWKPFDAIFTWSRELCSQGGRFIYIPPICYDFPFNSVHGIKASAKMPNRWGKRMNAICQIAGNKHSFMPSQLYSSRRRIARWFARHGTVPLDTYGTPPMPIPNYCGFCDSKIKTFSRYRFALCTENDSHPIWAKGYVTEKIFDCFYSFTIPIYLGAPDVASVIPDGCFIDFHKFPSLKDLDEFLSNLSDASCQNFLNAIEQFLSMEDFAKERSCFHLYESARKTAADPPPRAANEFGFLETASLYEKGCAHLMNTAFDMYKIFVGGTYAGIRK